MIYIKYKCRCTYLITDLPIKENIYICPKHKDQNNGGLFLAKDIDIVSYKNTNEYKFSYIGILDYHAKDEYRRSIDIDLNFKFYAVKKDPIGFIHEIYNRPIINVNRYNIMIENEIIDYMKEILIRELDEFKEFQKDLAILLDKKRFDDKFKNPDVYLEEKKQVSIKDALAKARFEYFDADSLKLIIDNLEEFNTSHVFYKDKMLNFDSFFVNEFSDKKKVKRVKAKKEKKSNSRDITLNLDEVI